MKLIDDAWFEFKKLWTIRILLLATVLNALAGCMFIFQDWIAPLMYVGMNLLLNVAAIVARMFAQKPRNSDAPDTSIDTFF